MKKILFIFVLFLLSSFKIDTQYKDFLNDLGWLESGNQVRCYKNGYVGKYMFSHYVFQELKYSFNYNKFLTDKTYFDEETQDKFCIEIFKVYKRYLNTYIKKYSGKTINGVKLNEANVLAACHLVGCGSMIAYFNSNFTYVPHDGNGVSIYVYMKKFEKYSTLTF